jgi:hypothetical protein
VRDQGEGQGEREGRRRAGWEQSWWSGVQSFNRSIRDSPAREAVRTLGPQPGRGEQEAAPSEAARGAKKQPRVAQCGDRKTDCSA